MSVASSAVAVAARFPWWVWAVLAICWFATISLRPLLEPDEGRYAEIPREMLASGDWVTPRLNDLQYLEKPPLQYWATASVYSLFGVSEWTSRAFAFLLAFLCLPMVYAFARSVSGSTGVGVAGALALAVNPAFAVIGRINLLDDAFTFFLSASLFAFLLAMQSDQRSSRERRWMLAMWASLGLAVLTKGIAAPMLCGATLLVYSLITRQWFVWRRLHWASGLALFAAIVVPWFFLVSQRNPGFVQFFFVHEHFQRFATDVSNRPGPWWYFLPYVAAAIVPWAAALWRQRQGMPTEPLASRCDAVRVEVFLLVWAAIVVVVFSVSQSKLVPYVLPAMPALAVVVASRIARDSRSMAAATWWVAGTLAIVGAAMLAHAMRELGAIPAGVALPVATTAIAVVWLVCDMLVRRRSHGLARSAWSIAAVSVFGWSLLAMSFAAADPSRSARSLVAAMRAQIGAETELFSVGQYRQTVAPYLGRTSRLVDFRGELDFGLRQEASDPEMSLDQFIRHWEGLRDGIAILSIDRYAKLEHQLAPFVIVARDRNSVVIKRT